MSAVPDRKITKDDIEAKLERAAGRGRRTHRSGQGRRVLAIAVGVVVVTIAAAYLLGRRKGKRRQTVLEIRRI